MDRRHRKKDHDTV